MSTNHPDDGRVGVTDRVPGAMLLTVGHGRRTTEDLASLLTAAEVLTVLDVRRYPDGRRQPHLARSRLAVDLPRLGVAYEWWGEALGGRRPPPPPSAAPSPWRTPGFAAYAAHMATDGFRTALVELEERAATGELVALMCAETLWWRCHRRLIADALMVDGFTVRHLLDRPPGQLHRVSSASIASMAPTSPTATPDAPL